ncbi:hypothetical protein [uncultured Psychroserpens sp.]|uniref:hypothetical protein n=1 Tax=uncultured Psychroserpens sp. TaxID=255436 RepID=UPI00260963B1|nr:hypothetical protein [uncultured Psychroserpens sp.]
MKLVYGLSIMLLLCQTHNNTKKEHFSILKQQETERIIAYNKLDSTKHLHENDESHLFDFLVGNFTFDGKTLNVENGNYYQYSGTWKVEKKMENRVITEEFRINNSNSVPIFLGITIRSYNKNTGKWVMGFFDVLNPSKWYPLGQPKKESGTITFEGKFPGLTKGQKLRIAFYDIEKSGFKWKSDLSNDNGKTWIDNYTLIQASRN